jgi:thiol:disulfide interchange protein
VIAVAAVVVSVLLAALALFQVALVAGAPLGRFAWGGRSEVLPPALRIGSVVSVVLYALIAWLVWRAVDRPEDGWIWLVTAYFALGIVLNAMSRSRPERLVMTPVVLVLAASCLVIAMA